MFCLNHKTHRNKEHSRRYSTGDCLVSHGSHMRRSVALKPFHPRLKPFLTKTEQFLQRCPTRGEFLIVS